MEIGKKGFGFTLDAMFALFITLIFISAAVYYLDPVSDSLYTRMYLNQLTQDSLSILEDSYALSNAVTSNSNTTLNEFQTELDRNICSTIYLYDQANTLKLTSVRTGCGTNSNLIVSRRSFMVGYKIHFARMEAWIR
jgi:hypothetical protein